MSTLYDDYSKAVAQQIATYKRLAWLKDEVDVAYRVVEHKHFPAQTLVLRTPLVTVEYRNTHHTPYAHLRPSMLGGCEPKSAAYWLAILHGATELAFSTGRVTALTHNANWQEPPITVRFRATRNVSNNAQVATSECFVGQRVEHPINVFLRELGWAWGFVKSWQPDLPHDTLTNLPDTALNDKPRARRLSQDIAKSLAKSPLFVLCAHAHALATLRLVQLEPPINEQGWAK